MFESKSSKILALCVTLAIVPSTSSAIEKGITNSTRNIFHTVNNNPTIAAKYFRKVSDGNYHQVYELRMCPNGGSSCGNYEKLVHQNFWKNAALQVSIGSVISDNSRGFPAFTEPAMKGYPRQCVALVKKMAADTRATQQWKRSRPVSGGAGDPYALGKVVAFFNGQYTYPQEKINGVYGHVGILLDYVYDRQGRAVGFWMLDQNLLNDGKIRKHLLMFNNGKTNSANGSNYHFVDFR